MVQDVLKFAEKKASAVNMELDGSLKLRVED